MKRHAFLLIVAFLIGLAHIGYASADIYRWVDENGVTHFSDVPPANMDAEPEIYVPQRVNMDSSPLPKSSSSSKARKTPAKRNRTKSTSAKSGSVELYSTSWCPSCKDAKKWLRRNKIPYTEYDVDKDRVANQRYRRLGSGGKIPFAVINGTKIVGFSPSRYKQALGMGSDR